VNTSDFRFPEKIMDKNSKKFKIQFEANCRVTLRVQILGTSYPLLSKMHRIDPTVWVVFFEHICLVWKKLFSILVVLMKLAFNQ
jgi:hypothetical protein